MKRVWMAVMLATVFGCSRGSNRIDFTKLDFGSFAAVDGGATAPGDPPGGPPAGQPGPDMASPPDPATCAALANEPVDWHFVDGVALDVSGPLEITVPDGVRLTGAINLANLPLDGELQQATISIEG